MTDSAYAYQGKMLPKRNRF